jgi:hypothetical protein
MGKAAGGLAAWKKVSGTDSGKFAARGKLAGIGT